MFWDKIYDFLLLILMLCFIPFLLLGIKQDQTVHDIVSDSVDEFLSKTCSTGIISSSQYMQLVNKLDATGLVYDIYLIHSSELVSPTLDENGNIIVDDTLSYYEDFINDEIFQLLFPSGETGIHNYYLNQGDYITLLIKNRTASYGSKYMSMIYPLATERNILVNQGGIIGNEYENR